MLEKRTRRGGDVVPAAQTYNPDDRRDSPRCLTPMVVGTQAFSIAGELGLGGASFSQWEPPTDDVLSVRVELFGTMHRLPARIIRTEKKGPAHTVHVVFDELPVETQLTLARWVQHRAA